MTISTSIDMRPQVATELTVAERAELGRYEAVIQRNLTSFLEAGRALMAIRDAKLYRATHDTFEDYCLERWDISYSYGHRMISAAEVVENLLPIGKVLPVNESQARPLVSLEPDQQVAAWKQATEVAGGRPTAAQVQQAADAIKPKPEPEPRLPIWELERRVGTFVDNEAKSNDGRSAETILDALRTQTRQSVKGGWLDQLMDAIPESYLKSDLIQAINNVREQRRVQKQQATSKTVYVDLPPAPPETEPDPPTDDELAAIAEVEAERVTEDAERLARAQARIDKVQAAWNEVREMQRQADAVFATTPRADLGLDRPNGGSSDDCTPKCLAHFGVRIYFRKKGASGDWSVMNERTGEMQEHGNWCSALRIALDMADANLSSSATLTGTGKDTQ